MKREHDTPSHGGNILKVARERQVPIEELHDFSASINPLGMPPGVAAAVQRALEEAGHYPEQHAAPLVEALASFHGIAEEHLLAGNGSTELIYLLPRVLRPKRAAIVVPAFGDYARALAQVGSSIDYLPLASADHFAFDPLKVAADVAAGVELVYVANPGHPSGVPIPREALLAFADRRQPLRAPFAHQVLRDPRSAGGIPGGSRRRGGTLDPGAGAVDGRRAGPARGPGLPR